MQLQDSATPRTLQGIVFLQTALMMFDERNSLRSCGGAVQRSFQISGIAFPIEGADFHQLDELADGKISTREFAALR